MSKVKLVSVWTPGNAFIRDAYSKTSDQFIPAELFEELVCSCGRRGMYTKAQVLNHLIKDHDLSDAEAKQVWLNAEEDLTAINAKTLFVRKDQPTPKEYENCRILSWEEWEREMEKARKEEERGKSHE